MRSHVILIMLAIFPLSLKAQLLNFALANERALMIERELPQDETMALTEAQTHIMGAVLGCIASTPRKSKATYVLQVGPEGEVLASWFDPDSATKRCFQNIEITHINYKPNFQPFYTTMELTLES